jgi:hypothetical protein
MSFDSDAIEDAEFVSGNFTSTEIVELCKASLDFLAGTCLPAVVKYLFPDIYKAIWLVITEKAQLYRDFSKIAIGFPRGFAKTLVMKIFCCYLIFFTKKKYILVIAGTRPKAINIIADVVSVLNEPNIRRVFGNWDMALTTDKEDFKVFSFRGRKIVLKGAGCLGDIRGDARDNARPDVIIFDDIQTREEADSQEVSAKIENWMQGTALKAKSPEGCLFLFVANMYPTKYSILKKLKQNPEWTKFIVGGILTDGTSLWEELQPIKQLLSEFRGDLAAGKPEIFYAEVLNDEEATVNHLIDISLIPRSPFTHKDIALGNFVVIDPATDKENADAVSIGLFDIYESKPVLQKLIEGSFSVQNTAKEAIKMCLENNCQFIFVEANAYQYALKERIEDLLLELGISGIQAIPIYSGKTSKVVRIVNMFKELQAGDLYYSQNIDVKAPVESQISAFNPLKNNNVDGLLDLLTYAQRIVAEWGLMLVKALTLENQASDLATPGSELETSPF